MAGVAPQGYMPADMVQRVLQSAGEDVILVGGQALAIWVDRYDVEVPSGVPAISRDVDFFTGDPADTAPLRRFAKAIGGSIDVMDPRNLTALVGIAYVEIDESSAGRKVAERHGLHVADALPVSEVQQGAFWDKQWPHLRKLMSPAYLFACEPLIGRR